MLHALKEYAESRRLTVQPGFRTKTIRWLLLFDATGRFIGLQELGDVDRPRSKGRSFPLCPDLSQPELKAGGAGCRHFLVDSVDVVTLLTKDGAIDDKLRAKHDYFVNLLRGAAESVPVLADIAEALCDEATLDRIRAELADDDRKAKPTDRTSFAVSDSASGEVAIIVESTAWHDWWRAFRTQLAEKRKPRTTGRAKKGRTPARPGPAARMRCLLSGDLIQPVATHPKITGLSDVGGLSMGDAVASFKQASFRSFGLAQAANSAMSEQMAETYRVSLNDLIVNRSHRLAGAKILYWYVGEKDVGPLDDPIAELFGGADFGEAAVAEGEKDADAPPRAEYLAESRARQLLDAIRTGQRADLMDCRFRAMTLSGNSGRVVVRDWMEGEFEELAANVSAWFDDLAIVRRDGVGRARAPKFAAVLAALVRELKDVPAPVVAALWQVALKNRRIPHQMMAQALARARIDVVKDNPPNHARMGLLKAYVVRDPRKELCDMQAELNEHVRDPAYLCGRIMAVLANIQRAALGDVGAGIVQRYYAAASATPALVLGRLVRLAQIGHLPKIASKGLRIWFDNQLAEIWNELAEAPPPMLTLEQQTLFALGYYQQKARRKDADTDADEAAEA